MATENFNDSRGTRPFVEIQSFTVTSANAADSVIFTASDLLPYPIQHLVAQITGGNTGGNLAGALQWRWEFSMDNTNWGNDSGSSFSIGQATGVKVATAAPVPFMRYSRAVVVANTLTGLDTVKFHLVLHSA